MLFEKIKKVEEIDEYWSGFFLVNVSFFLRCFIKFEMIDNATNLKCLEKSFFFLTEGSFWKVYLLGKYATLRFLGVSRRD